MKRLTAIMGTLSAQRTDRKPAVRPRMARPSITLSALLVLIAIALTATACGGSGGLVASATTDAPGTPTEQRLWIKDQDQTQPFENGQSLTVGGMNVEIYVSPYPPGRIANVDFYLTRDGVPVGDANLTLQYDMTVMEHGPFRLLAVPTGRGHYLAPLDFAMSGDFWLNVGVDAGGDELVINMLVRATR